MMLKLSLFNRQALLGVLALAAAVSLHANASEAMVSGLLVGRYTNDHEISMVSDDEKFESAKVNDTLVVSEIEGSQARAVRVELDSIMNGGSTCSVSEIFKVEKQSLVLKKHLEIFDADCTLVLTENRPGEILVKDVGGMCQMEMCGAAAALNGLVFKIK